MATTMKKGSPILFETNRGDNCGTTEGRDEHNPSWSLLRHPPPAARDVNTSLQIPHLPPLSPRLWLEVVRVWPSTTKPFSGLTEFWAPSRQQLAPITFWRVNVFRGVWSVQTKEVVGSSSMVILKHWSVWAEGKMSEEKTNTKRSTSPSWQSHLVLFGWMNLLSATCFSSPWVTSSSSSSSSSERSSRLCWKRGWPSDSRRPRDSGSASGGGAMIQPSIMGSSLLILSSGITFQKGRYVTLTPPQAPPPSPPPPRPPWGSVPAFSSPGQGPEWRRYLRTAKRVIPSEMDNGHVAP